MSPVNILFVSKTSSRRRQDMSLRCLQGMSSRRLIFKTCLQDVLSSRHVFRTLQDICSRRLEDVFSKIIFRLQKRLQKVLGDVFKTSSRSLGKPKKL